MMNNQIQYEELAKAPISNSRNIVISKCSKGGYTIAQQLAAEEENSRMIFVFLKGAFHIEDLNALYNLRNMCNVAIEKEEAARKVESESGWDE